MKEVNSSGIIGLKGILVRCQARMGLEMSTLNMLGSALLEEISEELRKGTVVKITGFGSFRPVKKAPKSFISVVSGKRSILPERWSVRFIPAKIGND